MQQGDRDKTPGEICEDRREVWLNGVQSVRERGRLKVGCWSVWRRLRTLILQEVAYPRLVEMFYRVVVQVVLMYGSDMWVILAAMEKKVERAYTVFLRQMTVKQALRIGERMWETPGAEVVWEASGTQSAMTYIGRHQATVVQWVALQPIFEVCAGDKSYRGVDTGGRLGGTNRR